jgi:hypothetical protein
MILFCEEKMQEPRKAVWQDLLLVGKEAALV